MKPLLLLAGLALSPVAMAGAASAATEAAVAPSADLDRLLDVLADEAVLRDLMFKAVDMQFQSMGQNDKDMASLFRDHPGLQQHLTTKTQEKIATLLPGALPELRASIGALLTQELTSKELAVMANFFATPSGKALYAVGANKGLHEEMTGKKADFGDAEIYKTIRKEDIPALLEFSKSGASNKLDAMGPRLEKMSGDWGEALMRAHEGEFETLGAEATIDFLSKEPATETTSGGAAT